MGGELTSLLLLLWFTLFLSRWYQMLFVLFVSSCFLKRVTKVLKWVTKVPEDPSAAHSFMCISTLGCLLHQGVTCELMLIWSHPPHSSFRFVAGCAAIWGELFCTWGHLLPVRGWLFPACVSLFCASGCSACSPAEASQGSVSKLWGPPSRPSWGQWGDVPLSFGHQGSAPSQC